MKFSIEFHNLLKNLCERVTHKNTSRYNGQLVHFQEDLEDE